MKLIFCKIFLFFILLTNIFCFIEDLGIDYINYDKYGYFYGLGTNEYKYVLINEKELKNISGEYFYLNIKENYNK